MNAALLARYRRLIAGRRTVAARALAAAWAALDSYDEADVDAYIAKVTPLIFAAKRSTVAATTAYYAAALGEAPAAVSSASVATTIDLRAPFTAMWHALAEGRPYEEALSAGRSVAEATGEEFVQSTARRTGDAVSAARRQPIRHRRVAEPGACPWCVSRNGGVYYTAESADYGHDRCRCDVVPITDD